MYLCFSLYLSIVFHFLISRQQATSMFNRGPMNDLMRGAGVWRPAYGPPPPSYHHPRHLGPGLGGLVQPQHHGLAAAGGQSRGDGTGRSGLLTGGSEPETPAALSPAPPAKIQLRSLALADGSWGREHVPSLPTTPVLDSELNAVNNHPAPVSCSDTAASETANPTDTVANPTNNNNNSKPKEDNVSNSSVLIRDLIQSKLAAVSEMMEHAGGMVLSNGPRRDFSPINNNELMKDSTTATAASIMNHLLKVRQEMALNMSKDSDSDRHTESPNHISDTDDKDEPINLRQHGDGRHSVAGCSGSDGEMSPPSPASDAGNSTGSGKDAKVSRLENIVGGLARSTSSPLPPAAGCKKRKLYQPIQHESMDEDTAKDEDEEEPDLKRKKDNLERLKNMQDQLVKMHSKLVIGGGNDENADPEEKDGELQIDLTREDRKFHGHTDEITIEKKINPKSFTGLGHPFMNGDHPLPLPPSSVNSNYMDLAKRFLQEQQDKITKDMITKDIVHSTIGRNDIAEKLAAISPELEGLADILKSEITTSLTIIVDSIVQRFLAAKRQPLGKHNELDNKSNKTPSGRAPQVRDRATPRTVANPLSMASPHTMSSVLNTSTTPLSLTTRPSLIPFSDNTKPFMTSLYSVCSDEDREDEEQDDALNLTVTPKKKRHKVTDTRITPRTVSRLIGDQQQLHSMAELQKHFNPSAQHFVPPGFPAMPKHLAELPATLRPPFPFSALPNSLAPAGLNDHFPFPPFAFPGAHLNRPRDLSPPMDNRPRSISPPRDCRPPPPLLHPAMLAAAHSPDMMRGCSTTDLDRPSSRTSSDDLRFDSLSGQTNFSLASMSGWSIVDY